MQRTLVLTLVSVLTLAAAATPAGAQAAPRAAAPPLPDLVAEACFKHVDSVKKMKAQVDLCRRARRGAITVADAPGLVQTLDDAGVDRTTAQKSVDNAVANPTAAGTTAAVDPAVTAAAGAQADKKEEELPVVPLGAGNWSLTMETYVGLLRVIFGSKAQGTVDKFATLSGAGAGIKFRYAPVVKEKQQTVEVIGLSLGLYYEPDLKTASTTNPGTTDSAQAISLMLMASTFHHVYAGVGWKFASSEPGYEHGLGVGANWMFVFGVGFDGKSL